MSQNIEVELKITYPSNQNTDEDNFCLSFRDSKSHSEFLVCKVPAADLMRALAGHYTYIQDATVDHLDRVGKNRQSKPLVFAIPGDAFSLRDYAEKHAQNHADRGWTASSYFGASKSFRYNQQDKTTMAHGTQYRWVLDDATDDTP